MKFFFGLVTGLFVALIILSVPKASAFGGNDLRLAATSLDSIAKSLTKIESKLAAPPKCVPQAKSRAVLSEPPAPTPLPALLK
jgi:hypothetical protein